MSADRLGALMVGLAPIARAPQNCSQGGTDRRDEKGQIMRKMVGLVLGAAMAAGCTNDPGFKGVPEVHEATAAQVTACRYVSDITGTPSVYGPILGGEGLKYTRNTVLQSAKEAGANTVVFDQVTPGVEVYALHAKAYAC